MAGHLPTVFSPPVAKQEITRLAGHLPAVISPYMAKQKITSTGRAFTCRVFLTGGQAENHRTLAGRLPTVFSPPVANASNWPSWPDAGQPPASRKNIFGAAWDFTLQSEFCIFIYNLVTAACVYSH